ncbi:MAG: alanine--glyoxylate aminotransferase family protein [Candidatus Thermoplasmatota archaeon]|nr:alanine--glyoxylate aminotransferase family protein [Candidatus Thermoplasmatota archaeon]
MVSRILMHVGPSVANYSVLSAGVQPNVGFASPEFNGAMKNSLEGLRYVTGSDSRYMPFILPGSGTVAMESVTSFFPKGSRILVVSNGVFGDRWEAILSRYPLEIKVLRSKPGSAVSVSEIEREVSSGKYFAIAMTHVETSTGVRLDVRAVAKAVHGKVNLVIVDGVASIGGEKMNVSEWGIDICLTASQKGIGAQAGSGLLVASEEAVHYLEKSSVAGYFMDLRNWKNIMEKFLSGEGGYFATPPIGTVFSISKSMDIIKAETMDLRIRRHEVCSEAFRRGIEHMGLGILAEEGLRSNTVSGVMADGINIPEFLQTALKRGVEFGAGVHPALRNRYFRVGHMGWIEPSHIIQALNVIELSMAEMGVKINRDSAVVAGELFQKHSEIGLIPQL